VAVLDQIETEALAVYSRSYTDREYSGGSVFNGTRRYWFSKVNPPPGATGLSNHLAIGGTAWLDVFTSSDLVKGRLQDVVEKYGKYSGPTQNLTVKLKTPSEIFADSVLPSPVDISLINGAKLTDGPGQEFESNSPTFQVQENPRKFKINLGTVVAQDGASAQTGHLTSSSGGNAPISDNAWAFSFPFEQRYASLDRFISPGFKKTYVVSHSGSIHSGGPLLVDHPSPYESDNYTLQWVFVDPTSDDLHIHTLADITTKGTGTGFAQQFGNYPRIERINKGYFGSRSRKVLKYGTLGASLRRTNPGKFPGSAATSIVFTADVKSGRQRMVDEWQLRIDAWKYGVYHGTPQPSFCHFRRDKYGQFRDMIEQRPFTKYHDIRTGVALDAPIKVTFASGSSAAVTASNPTVLNLNASGLYEREGRSGRPFNDV
jgi:hypothetical protein